MQMIFEICHLASHESSDEGLMFSLQGLDLGSVPVAGHPIESGLGPLDFFRNVHVVFRVDT